MRKRLTSIIVALSVISTMGFTVYAANPVQLQATNPTGSTVDYSGYTVKGYFTDIKGNAVSTKTESMPSSGSVSFDVPDGVYGFAYEVLNSAGEIVVDYTRAYTGNSNFWVTDNAIPVYLTTKAEEATINAVVDDADVAVMDLSVFGMNASQQNNNNTNTNTSAGTSNNTNDFVSEYTASIRILSDYNISLMKNNGLSIYATTSTDTFRIDIPTVSSDYTKYAIPSNADFSYMVYDDTNAVWKDIVINEVDNNVIDVTVNPKCLLYITNGKNTVNAKIGSDTYSDIEKLVFGVVNGETYSVINTDNNRVYSFIVPTNVTECTLDLSTMDGVPYNESAMQDATLEDSGEFENPYNVPLTSEKGESLNIGIISAIISGITLAISAFLSKKFIK